MKYHVEVLRTFVGSFEIEADTPEEAYKRSVQHAGDPSSVTFEDAQMDDETVVYELEGTRVAREVYRK